MKKKLSAILDDVVDEGDLEQVCHAMVRMDELRECARLYPLIGDALRGQSALGVNITFAVMKKLDAEPEIVVLQKRHLHWQRPVLALAASMAGVALVVWLAMPLTRQMEMPTQMGSNAQPAVVAISSSLKPEVTRDMREYLIAHQAQSANFQFQGGSEHIRTVSYFSGK